MRRFFQELKDFPKKCDWVLLMLCLVTAAFGLVVIASSTSAAKFEGNARYIIIQMGCILPPIPPKTLKTIPFIPPCIIKS